MDAEIRTLGEQQQNLIREIKEKQYMGVTEPVEVANTIAFLLSDAAKTITGTSILIDGGMMQG